MEIQAKPITVPPHPQIPLFHSSTIAHTWVSAAAAIHPHEHEGEADEDPKKKMMMMKIPCCAHEQESFGITDCALIKEELMDTGHEIIRRKTFSSSYSDNISSLDPAAAACNVVVVVKSAAAADPCPRPPSPPPLVSCRRRRIRREPGYPIRRCDRRVLKSILRSLWSTFFPAQIDEAPSSAGNTSTSRCSDGMACFRFKKEPMGACELENSEVASKTI